MRRLLRAWAGHQLAVLEVDMTLASGLNLVELREALKLRPMAEFDPDKPACIYDNLNEMFFEWDQKWADHYRQTAGPYRAKGYEELTDYDGLELLGWYPVPEAQRRPARTACDLHETDVLGASLLSRYVVEKTMRALNIAGVVALIALVFFVGWAAMDGTHDNQPSPGIAFATAPARR